MSVAIRSLARCCCWLAFLLAAVNAEAQYKLDHIPGFVGLESGTQPPPGLYVGNLVYVYPTSTIKDNDGNSIHLPGSLTSTADAILATVVTSYKILGANIGASLAFPFIKNRIQSDTLNLSTS